MLHPIKIKNNKLKRMKKEDIRKILLEKRQILQKIDEAYDKVLDKGTRSEGLCELEKLRGQDSAIPCILGHAHEMNFYENGHEIFEARKAIEEYERAISQGGYEFLRNDIERIKQDACI